MRRFPQTLASINATRRISFQKFLQTDTSYKTQRTIIIQLNSLHNFLVKNGIVAKQKPRPISTSIPPFEQMYQLHLQKLALLDRSKKIYNLVYHSSLHNQMTKILLLALFSNNDAVVQKIVDSGYPPEIIKRCIPLYHYFCATGNKTLMSNVPYKASSFFGLSASIISSFKGKIALDHIDFAFMTLKQYLLFNEFRGINTIDKKVNKFLSGYCGYSSESSVNSSNTETSSHDSDESFIHSQLQFERIRDDIDHKVLFPLDFLCIRNDFRAVEELLKHTPDFAMLSKFCFLLQSHAGITLKLLQYRADPNQSFRGYTPLHVAARIGNLDVAAIFIALNADLDAKDYFNRTPMYYAKLYKHERLVDFFNQSRNKRILPYVSTDFKFINFEVFESEPCRERLRLTKEHLKRAMEKQLQKRRFMIVSLFSLTAAIKTVQTDIKKLEDWKSERVCYTALNSYEKFKSIIIKR
ncbi:putative Ankyrin repeat-containing domain, Ankyrin repeat protein [Trachipleistophora hominis]|uniref:Putative Ankyrin repeat-containing domain, Ankyrin repeat protein n=1 Tax=Trachipleistophora hominis TaxID=72359 RepID=L7JYR6_TRAHO|nr:putative Ankyrin repeat-containing domain, Ankyrin repeat protein [Trachipleistophora hominis]